MLWTMDTNGDEAAGPLPLVVTDDAELLEASLRWCAAAGTTPFVTADPMLACGRWRSAPFVLVGQDCLSAMTHTRPGRRADVHIVCHDPEACWQSAVGLGAEHVVTSADDVLSDSLAAAAEGRAEACVVAVIGGSGGAGSSTFAAGFALEADRRDLAALAVDLDHTGGGFDTLLGCEHGSGVRWPDMSDTHGRLGGDSLRRLLLRQGGLSILSASREDIAPVPVAAIESVLRAGSRRFDIVVADVPRALGPAAQVVLTAATATVFVVPDDIRAVAAARAVMAQMDATPPNPVLLARPRRGGIGAVETARLLGLPLLSRLRDDRRISSAVNHGEGPGRSRQLRRAAGRTLDRLGLAR